MKKFFTIIFLCCSTVCLAEEPAWHYLEVRSGQPEKEWEIYQGTANASISLKNFSVAHFCATRLSQATAVHCYKLKATIKQSTDLQGDDVIALFIPQEANALSESCTGKYIRRTYPTGTTEEVNLRCNGSSDFRSFKRFTAH